MIHASLQRHLATGHNMDELFHSRDTFPLHPSLSCRALTSFSRSFWVFVQETQTVRVFIFSVAHFSPIVCFYEPFIRCCSTVFASLKSNCKMKLRAAGKTAISCPKSEAAISVCVCVCMEGGWGGG